MTEAVAGTVINAEITVDRYDNGVPGLVITFVSDDPVYTHDFFNIVFNGKKQPFRVVNIETYCDKRLLVNAVESGYYNHRLAANASTLKLDIRELIGVEVMKVGDYREHKAIERSSRLTT